MPVRFEAIFVLSLRACSAFGASASRSARENTASRPFNLDTLNQLHQLQEARRSKAHLLARAIFALCASRASTLNAGRPMASPGGAVRVPQELQQVRPTVLEVRCVGEESSLEGGEYACHRFSPHLASAP